MVAGARRGTVVRTGADVVVTGLGFTVVDVVVVDVDGSTAVTSRGAVAPVSGAANGIRTCRHVFENP